MFLDTIILLVRNENWAQANWHVTKANNLVKNKIKMSPAHRQAYDYTAQWTGKCVLSAFLGQYTLIIPVTSSVERGVKFPLLATSLN